MPIKIYAAFITLGTAATLSMVFTPGGLAQPNNADQSTATGTYYFSTGGVAGESPDNAASAATSKTLSGKAKIIDGRHDIAPGLIIHGS
jgi:hypothetical protein